MLRDQIKDDDCLCKSKTILEELTDEENKAVMPAGKTTDIDADDENTSPSGFQNLAETEKIAFRLGQINTLTFVRKNLEFLEAQAIQTLSDTKSFKKLGYSSNAQFAKAFGMSDRAFYNLKKSVQILGHDTYLAMRQAGYSKKDINFLAVKTEATVEKQDDVTYIKLGEAKFNINDKELLEDAISNLEKERDAEKKRTEKAHKDLESANDEIAQLKKKLEPIPENETDYDKRLHKALLELAGWTNNLQKIYAAGAGKEKLEEIFQAYAGQYSNLFSTALGKMG